MDSLYSVKLGKLIREFRLEVLRGAAGYEDRPIRTENVNRPGLQLTGFSTTSTPTGSRSSAGWRTPSCPA